MGKKAQAEEVAVNEDTSYLIHWLMTLIASLSQNQPNKDPVRHEALQRPLLYLLDDGEVKKKKKILMA